MADLGVTLIANLTVQDRDEYRKYEEGFFPILKKHGGSFTTFDDAPVTLEGEAPPAGRLVLFRFPSEARARAWFDDPEYQAIAKHRRASSSLRFLTLVHDLPPRG